MMIKQMQAAVVTKLGEVIIKSIDAPRPGPNDVLIKVKYCGICGTDLHIFNGHYGLENLPLVIGHEFSGYIEEVGSEVKKFKYGELVTADINLGCGDCFYCRKNQILLCPECRQIGIHANGAFAEYVCMPADKVYLLPEGMPAINGALVEPVSCVVRSARKSELTFANSLVIIGAGAVGLLHLQMAKNCGCAPIIMVDMSRDRLEYAKSMGADYAIMPDGSEAEKIREITEGRGADYVIESVGSVTTYENAFNYVRPGGRIVVFGITPADATIPLNPCNMILSEISMTATVAGMGSDVSEAMTMIKYNRFKLDDYTSVVYPLEKIADAFERAKNDKSVLKVIVEVT